MIDRQFEKKLEIEAASSVKRYKRKPTRKLVEYLFFRDENAHGTRSGDGIIDFHNAWDVALKDAGIEFYEYVEDGQKKRQKRIFHDFRRTAIRNLVRQGVSENIVMLISGHESRSVFDRYNIRDPRATRSALSKVGLSYHPVSEPVLGSASRKSGLQ